MISRTESVLSLATVVLLLAAAPGRGDTCCYSACGPTMQGSMQVLVTCEPKSCPEKTGFCAVWARKPTDGRCAEKDPCEARYYERDEADALVQRLKGDHGVIVVRPLTFELKGGERVRFERWPGRLRSGAGTPS